jgi:hypothetical protein
VVYVWRDCGSRKGRRGIMSREEGEKGGEMRMVKFGRSGGSVWRDCGGE